MHFPILEDNEYDIVHYYLVFEDKDGGPRRIYASSDEIFSHEVIEQSKKVAEENGLGQPKMIEMHRKLEILKEVPIE